MKIFLKLGILSILEAVVFIGCGVASIYNVSQSPIEVKITEEKVYAAIKRAGYKKGWLVRQIKPGLAKATINLRSHQAVVEIPYTASTFSINYKSSLNLRHDSVKGTIHSNYNGWIQNLEQEINFELDSLLK